MRATTIKCPECGATVNAAADAEVATCEYCGASAQIRRRSSILQRPLPLRAPEAGAPALPVATSARTIGAIGCSAILLGTLAAVVVPIVFAVRGCREESARKASMRAPRWDGISRLVHRDLTGDGVHDVIGRVRRLQPSDELMIAAFDGSNGKRLWISEPVGERNKAAGGPMAVVGETVILGDGGAGVLALDTSDGVVRWQIRLNEVVDQFCAGREAGTVLVRTRDEKLHPLTLAEGALRPAEGEARCEPLPNDDPRQDSPDRITYRWSNEHRDLVVRDRIEGMDSDTALHHVPSAVTIALGHREPGTAVPMLASYGWPASDAEQTLDADAIREQMVAAKDPERQRELYALYKQARERERAQGERAPAVAWIAVVPGVDPLSVSTGDPDAEQVDLDGKVVVVAYELSETHRFRLTSFSIADGKRRWDIELPGDRPLSAVIVTPSHAMVSRWDGLFVYDLGSGEHAYTIE